jgi:hypothetical protein
MMYRLKHVPSGLYFVPSREIVDPAQKYTYVKSNLSKTGKVYHRKPSVPHDNIYDTSKPKRTNARYGEDAYLHPTQDSDWLIEQII